MTVKDLERLYDYGYWANEKLFAVIAQLSPDEFRQDVAGSYGSIRNTLVHILSAEWGWVDRCGGPERGPALKAEDFPTLDAVRATWKKVEGYVRDFLGRLTDDDLERLVEFKNPRGETRSMLLYQLLHHAANHGVHHRGQISMLLRLLGRTPGNVDLLIYDAEKRAAPMTW
jgi:uncharacterized damage-inducible protein DinB